MLAIIFAIGYYLIFLTMTYGLIRTKKKSSYTNTKQASIIICGRNEELRISPLLESLERIDYPIENYEVILVDDSSTDNTQQIMQSFVEKHQNWRYLRHDKSRKAYKGKKGALDFGIQNSQFDIIIATDADCIVQPDWLKSMLSYFDGNVAMVQGYSPVTNRQDSLSIYQQFDTLAEGVTAASSMYFDNPTHANARNFAFRKSVYNEVGGFSKISHVDTGDDFYLAKLINKETDYKFCYNPDEEAFIFTDEVENLKDYWHQQLRRNSKGFDLNWQFLVLGGWLIVFHLLLAYLIISNQFQLFGILIGGKFLTEFSPVLFGAIKFNEKRVLWYFPILWFIYPILFFSSQILGSMKIYKWK